MIFLKPLAKIAVKATAFAVGVWTANKVIGYAVDKADENIDKTKEYCKKKHQEHKDKNKKS